MAASTDPTRCAILSGPGERGLHRDLLVEQHPDQECQRVLGEQSVGGFVTRDVQRHAASLAPAWHARPGTASLHEGVD